MSKEYPLVPLQDVLTHRSEFIEIDDFEVYKRCRVQLHAQGIVERDQVQGTEIKTKKQKVCRAKEFLVAEIDAKVGGFGVVPESLDGAIVSSHYFLFGIDETLLNVKFLDFYIRTQAFLNQVRAKGSTNYAAIRPSDVLSYKIPLPPIEEQRRIVARIEALAAKIEEARGLRREAVDEAEGLVSAGITQTLSKIKYQAKKVTVASVACSITDGDHQPPPKADNGIPFIFINHIASGKLNFVGCNYVPEDYYLSLSPSRVPQRGDLLYTAVGSYGIPCLVDTDDAFCFQRHIAIIKPNSEVISSDYLKWVLSSRDIYEQATKFATGSAQLTVPLRGIRQLTFLLPSMGLQNRLAAYFEEIHSQVDALKRHQAETSAELDALLPSILDKAFKGEL